MLLFEETKALEKALGEEAAIVIAKVFERQSALVTMELPTKHDLRTELRESELRTQLEIEKVRADVRETEAQLKIEIEKVRADVRETEARLNAKIEAAKVEMLKWITVGLLLVQTAIIVAATAALMKSPH